MLAINMFESRDHGRDQKWMHKSWSQPVHMEFVGNVQVRLKTIAVPLLC